MRLNINFDNNLGFSNLNPALCQDTANANILHNVFLGLYVYERNELRKGIVKDFHFNKNSNTYIFELEDRKWTNQTQVTSKDFVIPWMRIIKNKTCNVEQFRVIKNVNKFLKGDAEDRDIGIHIIDDKKFSVTLEYNCPYFLDITASTPYLPIPHNIPEEDIGLIGNKDYVVKRNNIQNILLQNINNNDEIYITCNGDEESIHKEFILKKIDISDGIPLMHMDYYQREELIEYIPEFGTSFIQFNCISLSREERYYIDRSIKKIILRVHINRIS
ncbi:hypothetical protein [Mangrovibacillus cuniculi]|uniref:Solute-binding protein family 5 domain-containing protein n=1 Tax=Mangrovibacillus cuniculi TaxID=2593652 RepID=A0A7S8CE45_9BACI|nr:hypothetical protein [Mangrovibacillus cuniculi]QPC48221.1 hypothetical protein G8O30_15500 [Mangrovibacillus cuniculi]